MTKISAIPASSVKAGDVIQLPNYREPLTVKSVQVRGAYIAAGRASLEAYLAALSA